MKHRDDKTKLHLTLNYENKYASNFVICFSKKMEMAHEDEGNSVLLLGMLEGSP